MDDERLIADGLAGRLEPDTPELERFKEHEESFAIALEALQLTREDRYVELCFGGGQVLERALATVQSAAGIDHSPGIRSEGRQPVLAAANPCRMRESRVGFFGLRRRLLDTDAMSKRHRIDDILDSLTASTPAEREHQ